MNSITTILSFIKQCNNNIDEALYYYIKTQDITLEDINLIKDYDMDDIYFIEFKNNLIRFLDDNLFITEYLLSSKPHIEVYIKKKYDLSYSNNRKYPYGVEFARKLSYSLLGKSRYILEDYINGYTKYYKNRKKEEKVKIKKK